MRPVDDEPGDVDERCDKGADDATGSKPRRRKASGSIDPASVPHSTLQNGLDLGVDYTVGSYFPTATDGLRTSPDGSVATAPSRSSESRPRSVPQTTRVQTPIGWWQSPISPRPPTSPGSESFAALETAGFGEVLGGVSFAPVPEPSTFALLGIGFAGVALIPWKRRPRA